MTRPQLKYKRTIVGRIAIWLLVTIVTTVAAAAAAAAQDFVPTPGNASMRALPCATTDSVEASCAVNQASTGARRAEETVLTDPDPHDCDSPNACPGMAPTVEKTQNRQHPVNQQTPRAN